MKYYGLDWLGTVLGLASIYYTGRCDAWALRLRLAASVFWAGFCLVAETPAGVVANLAAVVLCCRGARPREIPPHR